MFWKFRCRRLLTTSNQIIRRLPLLSFDYRSKPFLHGTAQSNKKIYGPELSQKSEMLLTSTIAQYTILNCRSDLISLSFFLWCAQKHNYFHEAVAFDCILNAVRRLTEQYKTVKGVILELESIGCVTKAKTFLILLRIYWRGGMYEMAFETYEQMESYGFVPNTFARNIVMDILFKIGRADLAFKLLKETQVPNFLTFSIALVHLSKLNDVSHMKHVLRVMLGMGYYPNAKTFEMVLNCFCNMKRIREAYQILGLMIALGITVSVSVWTILINVLCQLCRLDLAGNFLDKMVETGCSPNVVTYTTLIKAFMESNKVSEALCLLKAMECSGHVPDLVLCNVLIDCLSKVGRYRDAIGVFVSLSKQNITPDSYTFSSVMSTICLSRKFSLLPKLVHGHIIDADLVFFNSLISYYCKAGFPFLAVELYNDMINLGFAPDKRSFAALLSGLCAARRVDEAVNVYHGILMMNHDIDAHIHTVIIDGLIKVGKFHRAIAVFRKAILEKYPLDIVSYMVVINGFLRLGKTQEACTLYDQMKENGIIPNVHMCNMMLSAFYKEKDLKMVRKMLNEMIDLRIDIGYESLSNSCKYLCG